MPTVQLARILGQLCCVQRQSLTTHGHADADGTYAAARAAPPAAHARVAPGSQDGGSAQTVNM